MDLRDYLIRKRSIHQIAPRCHCEQLISTILSDCHCGFQINKPSILAGCQRLQTQPRDDDPGRRNHSPMLSTQKWLQTWWSRVSHQASPKGSNWLLVQKSQMLISLQVLRMFLSNLKGSTDTLESIREQLAQSTLVCWLGGLRWIISTPPSSNLGLWIPVRRQPSLLTWQELSRRGPSDSKSRPEFKENNSI